jgi:hypothetical protein
MYIFLQCGIETKATDSVRSPVCNLSKIQPELSVAALMGAVGREFLRSDDEGRDLGKGAISRQFGFTLVSPTDDWFPGTSFNNSMFFLNNKLLSSLLFKM